MTAPVGFGPAGLLGEQLSLRECMDQRGVFLITGGQPIPQFGYSIFVFRWVSKLVLASGEGLRPGEPGGVVDASACGAP